MLLSSVTAIVKQLSLFKGGISSIEQFTISFEMDFTEPISIQDRITGNPAEATIFIQDNDGNM